MSEQDLAGALRERLRSFTIVPSRNAIGRVLWPYFPDTQPFKAVKWRTAREGSWKFPAAKQCLGV